MVFLPNLNASTLPPLYKAKNSYKEPVARIIKNYRREDPPSTPQLAVPVQISEECQCAGYISNNPLKKAVRDLVIIAFYYLLRVGEYTKPRITIKNGKTRRATRTMQFSVANIGFFKDNKILPQESPLQKLLTADSCTFKISNQKNRRMGETIHQCAIPSKHCPVKAASHRVHHILQHHGNTDNLICNVFLSATNTWTQVTPQQMMKSIRSAAEALQLHKNGLNAYLLGMHLLRAGGTMTLKLQGEKDTTIMKMGRWTSLTFLQYIHHQIAHLKKDISQKMSKKIHFQNISTIQKP